jgi:hypothetical protein
MGRDGLLTQWIAKYGYLPIVLIGMAGLALEIGTAKWSDTIVAEAPVVAESFVERRPPTQETKAEPKPSMQLAALDPNARLLDESDQPASKGYIMYANSPTHWTPVPLPDEISTARARGFGCRQEEICSALVCGSSENTRSLKTEEEVSKRQITTAPKQVSSWLFHFKNDTSGNKGYFNYTRLCIHCAGDALSA